MRFAALAKAAQYFDEEGPKGFPLVLEACESGPALNSSLEVRMNQMGHVLVMDAIERIELTWLVHRPAQRSRYILQKAERDEHRTSKKQEVPTVWYMHAGHGGNAGSSRFEMRRTSSVHTDVDKNRT